jgi:hypothetical protein
MNALKCIATATSRNKFFLTSPTTCRMGKVIGQEKRHMCLRNLIFRRYTVEAPVKLRKKKDRHFLTVSNLYFRIGVLILLLTIRGKICTSCRFRKGMDHCGQSSLPPS